MSVASYTSQRRVQMGVLGIAVLITLIAIGIATSLFTYGFVNRALAVASPIAIAAIGGLYAEKSGVFNIGIEGFMIFGALTAAVTMFRLGGSSPGQGYIWFALVVSVLVTMILAAIFAVLLIRYKADQIVAGLAVWFIGLGFAPVVATIVWESRSSGGLSSINNVVVPGLSEIPIIGPILFNQSPLILLTAVFVAVSWVFLYRTKYGYWIQAAGENPEALDTAGIDVNRVRYAATIFSGAMAGLAGAVLLAHSGSFNAAGDTMIDGRGWLGIVAYLFGNYNPIGAALAALLFGGLDMVSVQLETLGINVSSRIVNVLPYIIVVVALTVWGKTQMPSSVGEPYESEE